MKERIFIQKAKEHLKLEEFVRSFFAEAKCGDIEVQYTPIVTRIIIHTTTPGLVIGSGGDKIREAAEEIKRAFKIENPQIDVQRIEEPDLEPHIIAQTIAAALENHVNFRRLGNFYLERVMHAGAIGCEIVMSGKMSGQRGNTHRFIAGYLKKCGYPAEKDVMKGFAVANPKLGNIGVTVKIMMSMPDVIARLPEHEEKKHKEEVRKESREKESAVEETKEASESTEVEEVKEAPAGE